MQEPQRPNILLGLSGSVAAIKGEELVKLLAEIGRVRIVATNAARHFFKPTELPANVTSYSDELEWHTWTKKGDPVLHIELRKWADVFVIAPLSANTLAKLATGLVLLERGTFQAMNTQMWLHPITAPQLATLQSWGVTQVAPVSKTLACGDTGLGAMASPEAIADAVRSALARSQPSTKPEVCCASSNNSK